MATSQYSTWYERAAEDAQLGRQKMMQDTARAKDARQRYSEYASQFETSPEVAQRYPEVERVAREASTVRQTIDYLMSQGLGHDDAEGKAYELLNAQKEANIASVNERIAEIKEGAKYQKGLSEFKTRMARIDYDNLATSEKEINDVLSEYSYLSGAHDDNISKLFDTTSQNALRRHQSAYRSVANRLPMGIPVEAVLDQAGRPNVSLINDALSGKLSVIATGAGEKAGAVAQGKLPTEKEFAGFKEGLKRGTMQMGADIKTGQIIPAQEVSRLRIQSAGTQGKQLSDIEKNEIKNLQTLSASGDKEATAKLEEKMKEIKSRQNVPMSSAQSEAAGQVGGTAFFPTGSTQIILPALTRPEDQEQPTVSEGESTALTPLSSSTPEATTEQAAPTQSASQFQEGQRIRQGNAIYEIRNGQPVQVQ
jgi:hypothetical protein